MPNAAEGFIIVMITVVGLAAARLLTLGDALGGLLRGRRNDSHSETEPDE